MSSKTKFNCDFCGAMIVHACKDGARGYCGINGFDNDKDMEWFNNPFIVINGPHICEQCVNSLIKSKSFSANGLTY